MLLDAFADTVTLFPNTFAPEAGDVIETVGATLLSLLTVTATLEEVARLPALSIATAVKMCQPLMLLVVSQFTEYGVAIDAVPRFAPSNWN